MTKEEIRYASIALSAAMQNDRDSGMTVMDIARKYNVSKTTVGKRTVNNRKRDGEKDLGHNHFPAGFAREWNMARLKLLGLRPEWMDEWNIARLTLIRLCKKEEV